MNILIRFAIYLEAEIKGINYLRAVILSGRSALVSFRDQQVQIVIIIEKRIMVQTPEMGEQNSLRKWCKYLSI